MCKEKCDEKDGSSLDAKTLINPSFIHLNIRSLKHSSTYTALHAESNIQNLMDLKCHRSTTYAYYKLWW